MYFAKNLMNNGKTAFQKQLVDLGKVKKEKFERTIDEQVKDLPFFSMGIPIGSQCKWIKDSFPNRSKYERSKADNLVIL